MLKSCSPALWQNTAQGGQDSCLLSLQCNSVKFLLHSIHCFVESGGCWNSPLAPELHQQQNNGHCLQDGEDVVQVHQLPQMLQQNHIPQHPCRDTMPLCSNAFVDCTASQMYTGRFSMCVAVGFSLTPGRCHTWALMRATALCGLTVVWLRRCCHSA